MSAKAILITGLLSAAIAGSAAAQTSPTFKRPSPNDVPACAGSVPAPRLAGDPPATPSVPTAERPPLPSAATPGPIRPGAMPKHNCFLAVAAKNDTDLLFVGNSITDFFLRGDRGQGVWLEHYGSMKAANIGISGDTTQDVMGRMQAGELDGFKAKVIVLMLGTNNLNRNPNADIVNGDAAIVAEFRKHQPQAKVLVLGIFPRGAKADNPARAQIKEINGGLAKLADNRSVFYLDIGDKFLNPDGSETDGVFVDGLHPSAMGYEIWARAIDPMIKQLMQ